MTLDTPRSKLTGWTPFGPKDIPRLRSHKPDWRLWDMVDDVWPHPYEAFEKAFWGWLERALREAQARTGLSLQPTQAHRDFGIDAQLEVDGLAVPFFSSLVYLATKRHMARLGVPGHGELRAGEPQPLAAYRDSGRYVLVRPLIPPILRRDDLFTVEPLAGYGQRRRLVIVPRLGLPLDPDLPWVQEEPEPEGVVWFTAARCAPELQQAVHEAHNSLAYELQTDDETAHVCELWANVPGSGGLSGRP